MHAAADLLGLHAMISRRIFNIDDSSKLHGKVKVRAQARACHAPGLAGVTASCAITNAPKPDILRFQSRLGLPELDPWSS